MLRVWSVSGQELTAAPAGTTFEDVIQLKGHLRSKHGFPVCLQQLLHAGRCLEDGAPLVGLVEVQLVLLSTLSRTQMPQAKREFLEYAASAGPVEVGRALLAAGVDKNMQHESTGLTALSLASFKGHIEIVRLLLDAGAHKDSQDRLGQTALMHASRKGHVEIVRLLLKGALWNSQDRDGETALMHASRRVALRPRDCCWTLVPTRIVRMGPPARPPSCSHLMRATSRLCVCCWRQVPT